MWEMHFFRSFNHARQTPYEIGAFNRKIIIIFADNALFCKKLKIKEVTD